MHFDHPAFFFVAFAAFILWLVVFLRSHRWRQYEGTFAAIWQRLSERQENRATGAKLRRVVSLTLATILATLLGITLASPQDTVDQHQEILRRFVFVVDNSPNAVRSRLDGTNQNLGAITGKITAIAKTLDPSDEVWVIASRRGNPVQLGPFSAQTQPELVRVLGRIEADFTFAGWENLLHQAKDATDHPSELQVETTLVVLTHNAGFLESSVPNLAPDTILIDVGNVGHEAAFLSVTQTGEGSAHVIARGGSNLLATFGGLRDASAQLSPSADGGVFVDLAFPPGEIELQLDLIQAEDPIPENNRIVLRGKELRKPTLGISSVYALGYSRLQALVKALIPEVSKINENHSGQIWDDFAIIDGISNAYIYSGTENILCFGALPKGFSEPIGAELGPKQRFSIAAPATIRASLQVPPELYGNAESFVFDGVQLFEVQPLAEVGAGWIPCLIDERLGPLAYFKKMPEANLLYFPFQLDDSTLVRHPAFAIFLRRWLHSALQAPVTSVVADVLQSAGSPITLRSPNVTEVEIVSPYLRTPRRLAVTTSVLRRAFTETQIPGRYQFSVSNPGSESSKALAEVRENYWLPDPLEVPYAPSPSSNMEWLPAQRPPKADKAFPESWVVRHWLLLAVLLLLIVEWGLYWTHAAE